ncbi:MAG: Asp-tRNA(Asn)/Glu-tRNA(Gln) amidotransferase subunit GatC [Planctomycetota bacterium]
MTISRDDVHYVADLARLELSGAEEARFQEQLDSILDYIDQLQEVDIDGVEPYISAAAEGNVFRDDAMRPGLPRDDALGNAPERDAVGFVVPKVVDGDASPA